jgi:hypothetical protein
LPNSIANSLLLNSLRPFSRFATRFGRIAAITKTRAEIQRA